MPGPAAGEPSPSWLVAGLLLAVAIPFAQLGRAAFVNLDDGLYVTANPYVQQGITAVGVRWALTAGEAGYWHPLTWVSHMLDVELFGLNAGGHHLTSVALHAVNTVLLFLALYRLTGAALRSAIVAFLFGVHPLHVESVAWISERKDVLSTTFVLLALLAYAAYVERPAPRRYLVVAVLFALALMCKPMVVTFPFLLLLLDVWPLRRLSFGLAPARVVVEKLPLVALSAIGGIVTVVYARGAIETLESYPPAYRVGNALIAYATYLRRVVWPSDLACFYPYPHALGASQIAGAALLLAAITVAAIRLRRERPYLLIGWLWFVGMLAPASGLVQVGDYALADRFTYLPLVGVFVMVVWAGADIAVSRRAPTAVVAILTGAAAVACLAAAWVQVSWWHDSAGLFRHALAVTRDNYMASTQVGLQYDAAGDLDAAARYYRAALDMNPDYANAHDNLGWLLARRGDAAGALEHYGAALADDPLDADARFHRGFLLQKLGRTAEAAEEYRRAIALRPSYVEAHTNLGTLLHAAHDLDGARAELTQALILRPDHVTARVNLGVVLRASGDVDGAIREYETALRFDPRSLEAHCNLGNALAQHGDVRAAIAHYREALRLRPDYEPARAMLQQALAQVGE